jgi:hypothetical protein
MAQIRSSLDVPWRRRSGSELRATSSSRRLHDTQLEARTMDLETAHDESAAAPMAISRNVPTETLVQMDVARARSASFIVTVSRAGFEPDGSRIGRLVGPSYSVKAATPNLLKIVQLPRPDLLPGERFSRNPWDTFVSDGVQQYELTSVNHWYVCGPAPESIATVVGTKGLPRHIAPEIVFATRALAEFKLCRRDELSDPPCDVYQSRQRVEGSPGFVTLFVNVDTHLPVRISYYIVTEEVPIEVKRLVVSQWQLNIEVTPSTFEMSLPQDASPAPARPPTHAARIRKGRVPPTLEATGIDGDIVSFRQLRGRVVLLHFWGLWGLPYKSMQQIRDLYETYMSSGLEVVGVCLNFRDGSFEDRFSRFRSQCDIRWPQIVDSPSYRGPIASAFGISRLPFCIVVRRNGRIASVNPGPRKIERAIKTALAA